MNKIYKDQISEDHQEDLRREARDRLDLQMQMDAEERVQQRPRAFYYHSNEVD